MNFNITDINHFLVLNNPLCKQHSLGLNSRQSRNLNNNKRLSSSFSNKKKNINFQIVNNKKVVIYINGQTNSFTFDNVQQTDKKYQHIWNFIILNNENGIQQKKDKCRLVIAQNYSIQDIYGLMETGGRSLLLKGINFQLTIMLQYSPITPNFNARNKMQKIENVKINANQHLVFNKKVRFLPELQQFIKESKNRCHNINRIWFINQQYQLGITFCTQYKENTAISSLQQLIKQYFIITPYTDKVNFHIFISLLADVPNEFNIDRCKQLFQQSILIKSQIKNSEINQNQFINNHNSELHIQPIYTFNSQEQKPIGCQQNPINLTDRLCHKNYIGKSNEIAAIIAENINLKWQIQTIKKQYQQQQIKIINKSNKKLDSLKQQNNKLIGQIKKIRKQNENLSNQIHSLKKKYQQEKQKILLQKNQIQSNLQNKATALQNLQLKLKQQEDQVKSLTQINLKLISSIQENKLDLEQIKNKLEVRIEQLSQQLQLTKKINYQLEIVCEQLQTQSRLDKVHCQHLQSRCKKYQQTLFSLLKMKMLTPSSDNPNRSIKFIFDHQNQFQDTQQVDINESQDIQINNLTQRSVSLSIEQRKRIIQAMGKNNYKETKKFISTNTKENINIQKLNQTKSKQKHRYYTKSINKLQYI